MTSISSITGEYKFEKEGKNKYKLDKNNSANLSYLYKCSALSFHKALIGISELKAIESVCNHIEAGGLRISKSITTYYIVYHLLNSLILLDDEEDVFVNGLQDGKVALEVSSELLNNDSETPEQWDNGKLYERDLASAISHTEIKKYCKKLREYKKDNAEVVLDEPYELLYKYFVHHDYSNKKSIKCLYEKLCYIRDRAVYRPTCVIDDKTGGDIQTSLHIRREIDQLPSYVELLAIITEVYQSMINAAIKYEKEGNVENKYLSFMISLWHSPIKENKEFLISLGWNEDDINKMEYVNADAFSFSSYMCQLVEIANKERFLSDIEHIWGPLKKTYYEMFYKSDKGMFINS